MKLGVVPHSAEYRQIQTQLAGMVFVGSDFFVSYKR